jgi:hypothetical protein
VVIGALFINTHPIVLKWCGGSARIIGKPVDATVYTNGQTNNNVKIFHVDKYWNGEKADYFILYIPYAEDQSQLKFSGLDRQNNFALKPSSASINDYDFIAGYLFQSEVGAKFSTFQDDMKGYGFDPKLIFIDRKIKLNVSPLAKELKCDSIRVEL